MKGKAYDLNMIFSGKFNRVKNEKDRIVNGGHSFIEKMHKAIDEQITLYAA